MAEEDFAMVLQQLGDEGDIISSLRNVYDWAILSDVLNGKNSVSEGKITVYEQHKKDLSFLKYFVKTSPIDTMRYLEMEILLAIMCHIHII